MGQQPRQIECTILVTLASSRSTAGLPVPSGGPFIRPLPRPDEGSAVPSELVPGAAALLPKAPPRLAEWCIPMPMPRLGAAPIAKPTQINAQRIESLVISKIPPSLFHNCLFGLAVPAAHEGLHGAATAARTAPPGQTNFPLSTLVSTLGVPGAFVLDTNRRYAD
jgi:hypothetical protein